MKTKIGMLVFVFCALHSPCEETTVIGVGDVMGLAHAIAENVEAKDAWGLKSSIAFLNVVLNKPIFADANFPKELEQHRKMVEQRLKKYSWGFLMLDVRRVLEQGGVDETQVGYSIANLEKIMGRFGV